MIHFTIRLPPISKKNSQQILINRATGKPFIMPSQAYKQYERQAMVFIPKGNTIDYAVNVKCLFYMPSHRKCDLTNLLEAVDDIMVNARLLADDNFTIIQSHDGSRVLYDKENPRTEVFIEKVESQTKISAKDYCDKMLIDILKMPKEEYQALMQKLKEKVSDK